MAISLKDCPFALELLDILADDAGLLLIVPAALHLDLLAGAAVGAERLAETSLIVRDEARRRAEDIGGGAVVALEPDDLGAGEVRLEAEDVVDLGATPAIDRLVVVADAADVAAALGQEPQPQILGDVGVLILVDQHEVKALLILRKHVSVFLEQPQILQEQIAEISGVQLLQALLIERIKLAPPAIGEGVGFALLHALRRQAPVLPPVDHAGEHAGGPSLLVDILGRQQLLEQPDLVVGVEHGERRLQIHELGVAAHDLHADGVESSKPRHALDHAADQLADPRLHLPRSLVGEGHGEDLGRPRPALAQNMGNPRREHPRLAGPRAGKHEEWPVKRLNRLALLLVESIEIAHGFQTHGAH